MSENIHAIFRVTCQDLKDGVWCALNERKIIWPCFFFKQQYIAAATLC